MAAKRPGRRAKTSAGKAKPAPATGRASPRAAGKAKSAPAARPARRKRSAQAASAPSPRAPSTATSPARPRAGHAGSEAAALAAVPNAPGAASQAVTLVRALETIESAYEAWDELRTARARARQRFADERRRLDEEGELLLGAVRTVTEGGVPPPPASAPRPDELVASADAAGLDRFLAEARARLDATRRALASEEAAAEAAYREAAAELRATVRQRVEARAQFSPPRVRLLPRSVGAEQRILHLERPVGEDAAVLAWILTGRLLSRLGAAFDDAVDDVFTGPTALYPDEGLGGDDLCPSPMRLHLLLDAQPEVWPLKGYLLQPLPDAHGGARFVRWLTRGPVLEAELEDGQGFRNVLSREEAERVTGALLTLKLAGKIELELGR